MFYQLRQRNDHNQFLQYHSSSEQSSLSTRLLKYISLTSSIHTARQYVEPIKSSKPSRHHATPHLCSSYSSSDTRSSLSSIQSCCLSICHLWCLLHNLCAFRQDQFDMTRMRHVRINLIRLVGKSHVQLSTYTTMSTIGSAALFWCLINLNVLNDQVASIESLCICVRFGIFE